MGLNQWKFAQILPKIEQPVAFLGILGGAIVTIGLICFFPLYKAWIFVLRLSWRIGVCQIVVISLLSGDVATFRFSVALGSRVQHPQVCTMTSSKAKVKSMLMEIATNRLTSKNTTNIPSNECPLCEGELSFHQPDVDLSDRLLGTCQECKTWYLMDGHRKIVRVIPAWSWAARLLWPALLSSQRRPNRKAFVFRLFSCLATWLSVQFFPFRGVIPLSERTNCSRSNNKYMIII